MDVVRYEYLRPQVELSPFHEVTRLLLEHRILICNRDELLITETLRVSDVCKIRITLFAIFSDDKWLIQLKTVFSK